MLPRVACACCWRSMSMYLVLLSLVVALLSARSTNQPTYPAVAASRLPSWWPVLYMGS